MEGLVTSDGNVRAIMLPQKWHWEAAEFTAIAADLGVSAIMQKRQWEWVMMGAALKALAPSGSGTALGIAVGSEPLIGLAEKLFAKVYCSDLWREDWVRSTGMPEASGRRLLVCADGRSLPIRDAQIDFVWSCSSIEHFGHSYSLTGKLARRGTRVLAQAGLRLPTNRKGAALGLAEIARVLKPAGTAIVSTEIVLNDASDPEFFGLHEFLTLIARAGLHLVSDRCTLALDSYFLDHILPRKRMRAWNDPLPHVYLKWEGAIFTSAVFVVEKS